MTPSEMSEFVEALDQVSAVSHDADETWSVEECCGIDARDALMCRDFAGWRWKHRAG
jgi:hypothetical protein